MRLLLAFIVALLLALGLAWQLGYLPAKQTIQPATQNAAGVLLVASDTTTLRPNVLAAATKLGQGRVAVAGLPTRQTYELPTLRATTVGLALQIPPDSLPGTATHRVLTTAEHRALEAANKARPTVPGVQNEHGSTSAALDAPAIRFDLYSWALGTLQATTVTAVTLTEPNYRNVPDTLETLARESSARSVLAVLPPDSPGLPSVLNPHDAYIAVMQINR